MAQALTETYQLGPFLLDVDAGVLTRAGSPAALGKRAVAVLAVLVRSAGEYVPKSRIMEAGWPGLVVQESNLAVQILSIRRALAEVDGGGAWVETLARRGYRFVGPVTRVPEVLSGSAGRAGRRSNLPEPLSSFVGRERERAELQELLACNRLVTLTGAGGVGKTRLAMRVADAVTDRYEDGAWLVELDALSDPDLLAQTVTVVLGLMEQPGQGLAQTLVDHLRDKRLLLLLDNAEHLLMACARLADDVLRKCPRTTLLVTSRERLGVPGELTYRVPSLSTPKPGCDATAHSVMDSESVRLFGDRVRLHLPQFAVTDQDAPTLARICRRLDGIALAIEMAAARLRSMSIAELDRRLGQRFMLLTFGASTVPHRQQTLRAAIDWSYDLLSDAEKALLHRLSVFAGGWTLESAERVCAGGGIQAGEVLDLLASLVDKSLVLAEERAAATRYRLLETVHRYAAERLGESDQAAPSYARHFAHFFELAEQAEPELTGKEQKAWLDRLAAEHDNVRLALTRSTMDGADVAAGLRLASAFARFWLVRGYLAEGRAWVARLLDASAEAPPAARAKAFNWAGVFAWKQGDYAAAQASYEKSLAIRRELGDRRGTGAVLSNLGLLAYEQGNYRAARVLHEESLAIDRELGDRWGIAHAIRSLGGLCSQQGDHPTARALFEESLAICRELGDRSGVARALYGLGVAARHQENTAVAHALYQESLAIYRELGDREGVANALRGLGEIAVAQGDGASARALYEESLLACRQLRDRVGIAAAVEGLADVAIAAGEPGRAACMLGAMERLREEIGAPPVRSERRRLERQIAAARTALDEDAQFDRAWQRGRSMTTDEAVACALDKGRAGSVTRG
jgi:predicted ATPase/DNA-binding winged helix-turn-helix (wHTH) protein